MKKVSKKLGRKKNNLILHPMKLQKQISLKDNNKNSRLFLLDSETLRKSIQINSINYHKSQLKKMLKTHNKLIFQKCKRTETFFFTNMQSPK